MGHSWTKAVIVIVIYTYIIINRDQKRALYKVVGEVAWSIDFHKTCTQGK